jgi:hypothetical protein
MANPDHHATVLPCAAMSIAFPIAPTARRLAGLVACALLLLACSEQGDGYYPLDDGRWWYFTTRTTILDEVAEQRLIMANIGVGKLADGTRVLIQRQSSGREVYIQKTNRGLERRAVRVPVLAERTPQAPSIILPATRSVGTSWKVATRLRLIESRTFARQDKLRNRDLPLELTMSIGSTDDAVTVPAGTFRNCIRVDGTGGRSVRTDRGNAMAKVTVEHHEWYAPGVGLVKATRSESAESPFLKAGHYAQELDSYR